MLKNDFTSDTQRLIKTDITPDISVNNRKMESRLLASSNIET